MGEDMYTVDRIEDNIVVLENRKSGKIEDLEKELFPSNIKEGDIVFLENGKYVIDEAKTREVKNNIRDRFNKLKK